ncbi:cytochrome P450 [Lentinula raphanica]|nr:cytochrome P450 [Lentinula raphanica]
MDSLNHLLSQFSLVHWVVVGVVTFILISSTKLLSKGQSGPLPPGPKGWPIIGNIFDIPAEYPWKVYRRWGQQFDSEIITLKLPGPPLLVLNSAKAADELLIKRSAIYSDRPRMVMLNELVHADWNLALMPYGERFKAARKLFSKHIDVPYVRPQAVVAVRKCLKDLLTATKHHDPIIRLMTGRFILASGYGIDVDSADDPYIEISETFIKSISHATQRGAFLVDAFPILKHWPSSFPGAGFKHFAAKLRKLADDARTLPFRFTQDELAKGTAKRSFATRFLETMREDTPQSEIDDVQAIIGNMYIAGADTTVLAMRTFVLAMALNPKIQKKAQAIVDAALGGRLPDFNDFGKIPYIDALVNETLRWKPPLPISIPHGPIEDDHYDGFFIPKGSIVVANICAILQDEEAYGPNTDLFNPDRFLTQTGELNKNMNADVAFGYGRRQCPGKVMAKELMWMAITSILATFDIHSAVDEHGVPLKPNVDYGPIGNLNYPPHFECSFVPRSSQTRAWIEDYSDEV